MASVTPVFGHPVSSSVSHSHDSASFPGDFTQLTKLLEEGDYQRIVGNQRLFFSAYCKAWMEHQETTGVIDPNWQVRLEEGNINLYCKEGFQDMWFAIGELRSHFLDALPKREIIETDEEIDGIETTEVAEICLVSVPRCNTHMYICGRIDSNNPRHRDSLAKMSENSLIFDVRHKCGYYAAYTPSTSMAPKSSKDGGGHFKT